ncbi:hypothetical protein D3C76_1321610 [compost metagenome]
MSLSMPATPRIGRVTPRAVSQTSSRPAMAAARPISRPTRLAVWFCWSSLSSSSRAGASSTSSGTSSSTLQGAAVGIGLNGSIIRSMPSCSICMDLPACRLLASSPALSPKALSSLALSRAASRLWPASRPAGLMMLTWPLPSNSSRFPAWLSCCRLSRLMSRPMTPTVLPFSCSGKAMLVISTWRSPTLSK